MATHNKWNPLITVNLCFDMEGNRKCLTLDSKEAFNIRNSVENQGGVVWWFTPI